VDEISVIQVCDATSSKILFSKIRDREVTCYSKTKMFSITTK